jgi:hypothetical protein
MRRTAATGMADIGVQPHVIEAVLNHVGGHKAGVAGIYNRSTYAAEKRAALDAWRTTSGSPSCRPQTERDCTREEIETNSGMSGDN